ncbi:hypothetical protein NBRC3293_2164 [Gluconobacter oxydans NBRC 3293]|uniref:Uncharacterized protein n=1 Tax=Gluconobacter oxydans NBRC 3293 TaxID=1315969 RepID=A0A829X4B0_GLUOY|nr:hypothetical protein NBRC3293_2164 [Gluconobacter oxydans NBRC 3293]
MPLVSRYVRVLQPGLRKKPGWSSASYDETGIRSRKTGSSQPQAAFCFSM